MDPLIRLQRRITIKDIGRNAVGLRDKSKEFRNRIMEPLGIVEPPNIDQLNGQLGDLLTQPYGLARVAQSMVTPLAAIVNERSLARRLFRVERLALNQDPIYDIDNPPSRIRIETTAQVTTVNVPSAELTHSNSSINLLNLAVQRAAEAIVNQENQMVFGLMDVATSTVSDNVTSNGITQAIAAITSRRLVARNIVMNPRNLSDVVSELRQGDGFHLSGSVGEVWGCSVIVNETVPEDRSYVTADPDRLGIFAIKNEIQGTANISLSANEYQFTFWEDVGAAILNRNALMNVTRRA